MALVQIASDNFTRANSANLGANWTVGPLTNTIGISSNQATNNTGSADCLERWTANSFTNDQYSQATMNQLNTGSDDFSGVTVHNTGSDYVIFQANQFAGTVQLIWYNAGAFTQLATDSGSTGNPVGKVFLLTVVGTTYTAYLNGTQVFQVTNGSTPATGNPGMDLSGTNVNQSLWASWSGGNITSGGHNLSLLGVGT